MARMWSPVFIYLFYTIFKEVYTFSWNSHSTKWPSITKLYKSKHYLQIAHVLKAFAAEEAAEVWAFAAGEESFFYSFKRTFLSFNFLSYFIALSFLAGICLGYVHKHKIIK